MTRWAKVLLAALAVSSTLLAVRAAELTGTPQDRILTDLKYLADDKLEGRGVGTDGLNLAADYVKQQFAAAGLDVKTVDGDAFQKFTMVTGSKLTEPNSLTFLGPDDKEISFELEKDFNVCSFGGAAEFSGEIVFGGYAIDAKGVGYHDFKDVDVEGKIVIVMRRNPQQGNPKSKFAAGDGISRHASIRSKMSVCSNSGAAAVLFVNDPHTTDSEAEKAIDNANTAVVKAATALTKIEAGAEGYAEARKKLDDALARVTKAQDRTDTGDFDQLMRFGYAGNGKDGSIPALHISQAKVDELLKAALKTSMADIANEIDSDLKPRTKLVEGWSVKGQTNIERVRTEVKNVVAVLEGEGPLADETIVVGAHYDHVGFGQQGSLAPGSNEVHNGADDNASGTVALIELARRLAAREQPLPRRVVFIAFSAEELGLIGSAKYVDQPVFPLEKTVAMFNLDMVGRLREKLTVFGVGTSPTFESDVKRFGATHELQLTLKPEGLGPSDHSSFYRKKIPVLHFFTGTHTDYHRPGDDWNKVNVPGIDQILRLAHDIVVHTAEAQKRPEYVEIDGHAQIQRSGSRPYVGSIPNFNSEEEGYAISGTSPGSPAAKAGLKAGDHIIQFGKHKVTDLIDYDLALRKFSAGDKVEVKVRRKGEVVTLKVTLAKPK